MHRSRCIRAGAASPGMTWRWRGAGWGDFQWRARVIPWSLAWQKPLIPLKFFYKTTRKRCLSGKVWCFLGMALLLGVRPFLAVSVNPVWERSAMWSWYPVRAGDQAMPPDSGEEVFILLPRHLNLKLHVLLHVILEYSRKDSPTQYSKIITLHFFIIIIFFYNLLFLAVLDLHSFMGFSLVVASGGYSLVAASYCGDSLGCVGFSGCGGWAQ